MIDEKRLDEWEEATRRMFSEVKPTTGTAAAVAQANLDQYMEVIRLARLGLNAEKAGEEIAAAAEAAGVTDPADFSRRLMLLGLWAEKHGIPHLKSGEHTGSVFCTVCDDWAEQCPALAALPKETK